MSAAAPTLVILAAGAASRYGSPKQLEPMGPGGATVMDYTIHDARQSGFGSVVLVIRREMESLFAERIAAKWKATMPVAFAYQDVPATRTKPWGTGDAVLAASSRVSGPFAVANADDFYGRSAITALGKFLGRAARNEYGVVSYPLRTTLTESGGVNRALCKRNADGWLEDIEELFDLRPTPKGARESATGRELPGDAPVSMNLWGFTPLLFDQLHSAFATFQKSHANDPKSEFLLPDVIRAEIKSGGARVQVLDGGDEWCGVTYPADRDRVARFLETRVRAGAYPTEPWR
ncbi:MAG TPA: NTP transferase domain-containing protein [Gemmatimonadales bacterium]|nr:NTP transferase domain-containing protein [Gemmatimonadales bacterium]